MDRSASMPTPTPLPGEVHLWLARDALPADAELAQCYSHWLSTRERERWQRFRFAKDRDRYLLARALVRGTLTRYRPHINEQDWAFDVNPQGRPSITRALQGEGAALHFNLSHTRGLIALAVGTSAELGVDTEPVDRDGRHLTIAEHFFADAEAQALRSLVGDAAQQRRFFELWTLKEAYIKARGLGLALSLGSFAFAFSGASALSFRTWPEAEDRAAGWGFVLMTYRQTHRVALALREGVTMSSITVRAMEVVPGAERYACPALEIDRTTSARAKILPLGS